MKVIRLSALPTGRVYTHRKYSWYSFLLEAETTPRGRSATGRITSMKNSNDIIGNGTRDLPTCSAVPQPTAPRRGPKYIFCCWGHWIVITVVPSCEKVSGCEESRVGIYITKYSIAKQQYWRWRTVALHGNAFHIHKFTATYASIRHKGNILMRFHGDNALRERNIMSHYRFIDTYIYQRFVRKRFQARPKKKNHDG
jgi:hypothetical protein